MISRRNNGWTVKIQRNNEERTDGTEDRAKLRDENEGQEASEATAPEPPEDPRADRGTPLKQKEAGPRMTEIRHRPCKNCGGFDEYLYSINGRPLFYCADCDTKSGSGAELVGADERMEEETGR